MRPQDRTVFAAAARDLGVWILVRRTNPASLPYIGRALYVPKPIDCKAKTADRDPVRPGGRGVYRLGGLVADPTLVPEAFVPGKYEKALEIWAEFKAEHIDIQRGPHRYAVVTDKRLKHYGAVTRNDKYIHGDYDLYDVVDPAQPSRNLALVGQLLGQPHMRGPRLQRVMDYVNGRIGADMVQHGGEYQYAGHSDQVLDVFGPTGQSGAFSDAASVRAFYAKEFMGRRSTTDSPWPQPTGAVATGNVVSFKRRT